MSNARAHRDLKNRIRLAVGKVPYAVLWPNESGVADYGGSMVRYGVGQGGADLIGIVKGRFIALEVKTGNAKLTKQQARFLELVRQKGGYAAVVHSVDEAMKALEDACNSFVP